MYKMITSASYTWKYAAVIEVAAMLSGLQLECCSEGMSICQEECIEQPVDKSESISDTFSQTGRDK